jgi:hypothetical protein
MRLAGRENCQPRSVDMLHGHGHGPFDGTSLPEWSRGAGCFGRRGPGASKGLRVPALEFGGRQMPAACWAKITNVAQWMCSKGTGTVLSTAWAAWVVPGSRLHRSARAWRE